MLLKMRLVERILILDNICIETKTYKYGKYPFTTFNPVQSEVLRRGNDNFNLVVASPTASGKTICGEILGGQVLHRRMRVIYLSPLKALAEEKLGEWSAITHPWAKYKKCILTGDYKLTEEKRRELEKARIVISTYEMMAVRCRNDKWEKNTWLKKAGILIVDEAHFLSSEGRGDHLENALILFSRINSSARLVLLSATLLNCQEIAGWVERLTNKKTELIESKYRPCPLTVHFVTYTMPSTQMWQKYMVGRCKDCKGY